MDRITFSDGSGSATRDYAYDARGNATQRGGVGHSFDRANRMVAGAGESHRYDGHGRRVHTIRADGARSSQLYGLSGQLLQESGTGGQPGCAPAADRIYCHGFDPPGSTEATTRYVHLGGRLIAQVSGNSIAYVHTDRLGSVAMLTGPARQVLRQTRYAPYGSTTNGVYVQGPGYTGHVTDAASQLHYMQQRYYDPVAMRFVSVDPVNVDPGTGGNFNRYAYANNNPYRYIDPDGRQACPTGAAICYEAPSTKQGPAQPAISDSQRTRDSHVAAARSSGRLSDGTQLDLRREEQSFRVDNVGTAGGIDEVQGCVTCNGRPVRTMAFSYPPDSSPGHTHGEGIEQLPGRDDASRAAQTGQTAYMISKTRAFAIEHTPIGYRVRIVNGPRLSVSEMREMEKKIETWNTNHGTGGGSCTPGC